MRFHFKMRSYFPSMRLLALGEQMYPANQPRSPHPPQNKTKKHKNSVAFHLSTPTNIHIYVYTHKHRISPLNKQKNTYPSPNFTKPSPTVHLYSSALTSWDGCDFARSEGSSFVTTFNAFHGCVMPNLWVS